MAAGRSSSYADRLSRQYEQQVGQPADATTPGYGDWIKTAMPSMIQGDRDALARSQGRWKTADKLAGIGVGAVLTGGLGSALLSGGTMAGNAGYVAKDIANVAGRVGLPGAVSHVGAVASSPWSLGSILNSPVAGLGINSLLSIFGNRSASKQQQNAINAQMRANAEATQLARDQMASQQEQFKLSQADQRAALDASNELRRRELASSEEDRAYTRRLSEEREARLAPYRANAQRWAQTLAQMLRS